MRCFSRLPLLLHLFIPEKAHFLAAENNIFFKGESRFRFYYTRAPAGLKFRE